ncbi:MAG: hypothetical protein RMK57_09870 [Bryobacterales bacterium]|nr:hypothetical protein [Bryobacteraceae bacterium]MDW8354825.1 hypothetical protein [Bryobacterales bacterium]
MKDLRLPMVLYEPNLSIAPEHGFVENYLPGLEVSLRERAMVFGAHGMPSEGGRGVPFLGAEAMEGAVVAIGIGGPAPHRQ